MSHLVSRQEGPVVDVWCRGWRVTFRGPHARPVPVHEPAPDPTPSPVPDLLWEEQGDEIDVKRDGWLVTFFASGPPNIAPAKPPANNDSWYRIDAVRIVP